VDDVLRWKYKMVSEKTYCGDSEVYNISCNLLWLTFCKFFVTYPGK